MRNNHGHSNHYSMSWKFIIFGILAILWAIYREDHTSDEERRNTWR